MTYHGIDSANYQNALRASIGTALGAHAAEGPWASAVRVAFRAILHLHGAAMSGAVRAAIQRARRFDAVSDDAAVAVIANWRERVDRAFEAVEDVRLAGDDDFEALVVFVAAGFARAAGHAPSAGFQGGLRNFRSEYFLDHGR